METFGTTVKGILAIPPENQIKIVAAKSPKTINFVVA